MEYLTLLLVFAILGVTLYMARMVIPIKLHSYQAVIKGKRVELLTKSLDYAAGGGDKYNQTFGLNYRNYFLITEENQMVETSKNLYESVNVGDTITVTVFSNGDRELIEENASFVPEQSIFCAFFGFVLFLASIDVDVKRILANRGFPSYSGLIILGVGILLMFFGVYSYNRYKKDSFVDY